jgi:hypothetical protein
LWTRVIGGTGANDFGENIQQTTDGGFIMAGYTDSFSPSGSIDYYIIKLDANGNSVWTQTFGGIESDQAYCVQQTTDGGYIIIGQTMSYGAGNMDYYIIRLEADTQFSPITVNLTPHNPPIQIPAGGGNFQYDLQLSNVGSTSYTIDFQLSATVPGGTTYPIFARSGVNLFPGVTITRNNMTQFVPATVPAGDYTYNARVYNHNTWQLLAEDTFDFVKLAGDEAPVHNMGWACYGFDDEETIEIAPESYNICQAYPNPFNPETNIVFELPQTGYVTLTIYDAAGREVAVLVDGIVSAGKHTAVFDGSNLSSGVYFAEFAADGYSNIQKLLLVK